jgi:FkbM family methyltransferase
MLKQAASRLLERLHRVLGRTELGTTLALKARNQCNAVVCARLSDGTEFEANGELLLISLIAPQATEFVDVGANVGDWARHFSRLMPAGGHGLLFEPSPDSATMLRKARASFPCAVEIVEAALADEDKEGGLFYSEPGSGKTSSLVPGFSRPDAVKTVVRVATLDQELQSRGIDRVDFLKIDTEGFDLKVLIGASRSISNRSVGVIQFEYNAPWADAGATLAGAREFLETRGYGVYVLKRDGLHRCRWKRYGEYYSYSNYVAVSPDYLSRVAELMKGEL